MKKLLDNKKSLLLLTLIIISGAVLRLYNLNWDQGHYLHPDERLYVNASNITFPQSLDEFLSPQSSLNPHMFYYGSFPLYLYKILNIILTNQTFLITSRLVSAIFSILTVPLIFLTGQALFSKKVGLLSALIFTFAPQSIQYAHFNTTESVLTFLLTLILYLSIKNLKHPGYLITILIGIASGLAYATKVTGLTFLVIPACSFLFLYLKQRRISHIIGNLLVFSLIAIIIGSLFAPYQTIDFANFKQQQDYMQAVIYGKDKPPFVIIYEGTIPYLYQLAKVFPFTFGFIAFPLSILGLLLIGKDFFKNKKIFYFCLFIFLPLLYLLWSGAWYAKFSRYYSLLFPFLSIWAAFVVDKLKGVVLVIICSLIILNGLLFLRIYIQTNTRIEASLWIDNNILSENIIAGEHWDDNLPLPITTGGVIPQYTITQLPVYDQPDSPTKMAMIADSLSKSNYFIISSRRVYYSILQNADKYPETSNFYKQLFAEKLGFHLVKKFTNYPFYFSDDFADESFQSYDHPPVYIFKNEARLSSFNIKKEILTQ